MLYVCIEAFENNQLQMSTKTEVSEKELVVAKKNTSPKLWMSQGEYTNIVVSAKQSNNEYVISDGIIEPNGFVPDHYHKWEDQTFHVLEGVVEAKIGNEIYQLQAGDTVHCPRGITHFMQNKGQKNARLLSYTFPGTWAEDFMEETSKQNRSRKFDLDLIEEKYGVVYR